LGALSKFEALFLLAKNFLLDRARYIPLRPESPMLFGSSRREKSLLLFQLVTFSSYNKDPPLPLDQKFLSYIVITFDVKTGYQFKSIVYWLMTLFPIP
jgi:hypothetical protein